MLFGKLFTRETTIQKAIKLLEEAAREGNLEAEQLLNFYRSLSEHHFSPIQSSLGRLPDMEEVVKCVRSAKKIKKTKRRKNKRDK